MDIVNGTYLGKSVQKPIIIECYNDNKKTFSPVVVGRMGRGMGYHLKFVVFKERYIIDNHLNNNNWLKQHRLPMIRKGHPFYKECKSCKGRNTSKIIFLDPKSDCLK